MVDASLTFFTKSLDTLLRGGLEQEDGNSSSVGGGTEGGQDPGTGDMTTEQLLDGKLRELTTSVEMFRGAQIFIPTLEPLTG